MFSSINLIAYSICSCVLFCNNRFNAANSLLVAGAEKLLACQAKFSNSSHVLIMLALNFPDNLKRIFSDVFLGNRLNSLVLDDGKQLQSRAAWLFDTPLPFGNLVFADVQIHGKSSLR